MESSFEKWRTLTQPPAVVEFFRGLFERVGVRVTDTGEQFAARHEGDRIELEPTLSPERVDYVVDIRSAQVDRLAEHARTGLLDEAEQYRIVSTLFTPATAAKLRNPVLAHPVIRRLAGAEDVIHVQLQSPVASEPDVQHTLIYAGRQWLVFPGLHGRPGRVFRLNLAEAVDYHHRVFAALKQNRWSEWVKFARWYRAWRKRVSTRP